jgi:arylsulfatase A-like enzyme
MEKFELMGLDKDTMVLLFSDHGILLGEHGLMKKKNSFLYTELLDNPMMLRIPGGPVKEQRLKGLVHESDFAPTFLRQMGVDVPESMTGLDFWPMITGEKETIRDYAIGGFGDWAYVQDDQYHYFRGLTGKTETHLYDIQTDPAMERNLCEEKQDVVKVMEEKMTEGLKGWSPPDNLVDGRLPQQPKYSPLPLKSDS